MVRGRMREAWNHTASIRFQIANVISKTTIPFEKFHPMGTTATVKRGSIHDLKALMPPGAST